jgi:DNA polymerase III alpha subunit
MLGIEALALVDRNSLAGIARAHEAAKTTGVRRVVGFRAISTSPFEDLKIAGFEPLPWPQECVLTIWSTVVTCS